MFIFCGCYYSYRKLWIFIKYISVQRSTHARSRLPRPRRTMSTTSRELFSWIWSLVWSTASSTPPTPNSTIMRTSTCQSTGEGPGTTGPVDTPRYLHGSTVGRVPVIAGTSLLLCAVCSLRSHLKIPSIVPWPRLKYFLHHFYTHTGQEF